MKKNELEIDGEKMNTSKTKKNNNNECDDKFKKESLLKEYEIKFQMMIGFSKRHLEIIVVYLTLAGTSYAFVLEKVVGKVPIAALNIALSLFVIYWLVDIHRHYNVTGDRLDVISSILEIASYHRKEKLFGKTTLSILILYWIDDLLDFCYIRSALKKWLAIFFDMC